MELHEILNDWCEAASQTNQALRHIGKNLESRREIRHKASVGNGGGGSYVVSVIRIKRSYVDSARREIDSLMQPSAPLMQRWSPDKRRQAGRRSLRNLMTIYCGDLLLSFELAVEARTEWIGRYREFIEDALAGNEVCRDRLRALRTETMYTTHELQVVRDRLKEFIKEQYPMGAAQGEAPLGSGSS
ncbi:hypothetical protein [Streptomyces sp. KL116D]|uniref:hypothetical protein n=1 Tax=Streptomyces sp. KL116D TaxID=3045152 RepID=UPI003558EC26